MSSSTRSIGRAGLIAAAIVGALASTYSPVSTADPGSVNVTVKTADLNISTPSGALALYERIRLAAQAACSYYWFERDADERRCVHTAIENAVTKINQPVLSAVYHAKYKTAAPSTLVSQSR